MWSFSRKLKNLEHCRQLPCNRHSVQVDSAKSIQNLFDIVKQGGQLPSLRHYAYSDPSTIDLSKPTQNVTSYSVAMALARDNEVYNSLREKHSSELAQEQAEKDFQAKVDQAVNDKLAANSSIQSTAN